MNSSLDLALEVKHAATGIRYANGNDARLDTSGPIALFGSYKLTTGSGKHLEDDNQTHFVSLKYKLKTSAKDTDEISIGFDRDRHRRQRESTNNTKQKGKHHERSLLRVIFG